MVLVSYTKGGYYTSMEAYGDGILAVDDMKYVADGLQRNKEKISFILEDGITGADEGALDAVRFLQELVVSKTVTHIGVSEKLKKIFKKNDVVVRGDFGTYAEVFAQENGILFMHRDVKIGCHEGKHEDCQITLMFDPRGNPYIRENYISSGSNAGNVGGGEIIQNLSSTFFMNMTAGDVADKCSPELHDTIANSEALINFIEVAKEKGGIKIKPDKR